MKEGIGVAPYGGDLNKIPSRTVDAFVILQGEMARVDNLSMASSHSPAPQRPQQRNRR